MYLFKSVRQLNDFLTPARPGQSIGFVPTMGALHEGHLSLIEASVRSHDLTVCSIFVNPTQFNEQTDLEKYPRTPAADIDFLVAAGCDVLFMPPVTEIYPPGRELASPRPPAALIQGMEGRFRVGHFEGVVQVVHRLLDIVRPTHLYMGQKDYQQAAIIRWMIADQGLPVQLVIGPTRREADGLAMSSRNVRLQPDIRKEAGILYACLTEAKEKLYQMEVGAIREQAMQKLSKPGFRPEYFEIVDGWSLQPLSEVNPTDLIVACTAVWAGEVRLIDNLILQEPGQKA